MTGGATETILARYRDNAADLGERFNQLDTAVLLAPVLAHLPDPPARVLDIGAGTGRDARWLTARGHRVTAVEPVAALAGFDEPEGARIEWVRDTFPQLARLSGRRSGFDCALAVGLWQHLDPDQQAAGMVRVSQLLRPLGRFILSLRQGRDADNHLIHDCHPDRTVRHAEQAGFAVAAQTEPLPFDPCGTHPGVTWTWLVVEKAAT